MVTADKDGKGKNDERAGDGAAQPLKKAVPELTSEVLNALPVPTVFTLPGGAGAAPGDVSSDDSAAMRLGVTLRLPESQRLKRREMDERVGEERKMLDQHDTQLGGILIGLLRRDKAESLRTLAIRRMEAFEGVREGLTSRVGRAIGEIRTGRVQRRRMLRIAHERTLGRLQSIIRERLRVALHNVLEKGVRNLKEDHTAAIERLQRRHAIQVEENAMILRELRLRHEAASKACRTRFFGEREILSKKFSNEFEVMKIETEEAIGRTKSLHDAVVEKHNARIGDIARKQYDLVADNATVAAELKTLSRRIRVVADQEAAWKLKLLSNMNDSTKRNEQLELEIDEMKRLYHALRHRMSEFRCKKRDNLVRIVRLSKEAEIEIKQELELAEMITARQRVIAGMQTSKEKAMWSKKVLNITIPPGGGGGGGGHSHGHSQGDALPPHAAAASSASYETMTPTKATTRGLTEPSSEVKSFVSSSNAIANSNTTNTNSNAATELKTDAGWEHMRRFHKMCNRVRLEVLAHQRQHESLVARNSELRDRLKKFIRGFTVNPDIMDGSNTLVMVNKVVVGPNKTRRSSRVHSRHGVMKIL